MQMSERIDYSTSPLSHQRSWKMLWANQITDLFGCLVLYFKIIAIFHAVFLLGCATMNTSACLLPTVYDIDLFARIVMDDTDTMDREHESTSNTSCAPMNTSACMLPTGCTLDFNARIDMDVTDTMDCEDKVLESNSNASCAPMNTSACLFPTVYDIELSAPSVLDDTDTMNREHESTSSASCAHMNPSACMSRCDVGLTNVFIDTSTRRFKIHSSVKKLKRMRIVETDIYTVDEHMKLALDAEFKMNDSISKMREYGDKLKLEKEKLEKIREEKYFHYNKLEEISVLMHLKDQYKLAPQGFHLVCKKSQPTIFFAC